jgi:hypothetical protein
VGKNAIYKERQSLLEVLGLSVGSRFNTGLRGRRLGKIQNKPPATIMRTAPVLQKSLHFDENVHLLLKIVLERLHQILNELPH